jgi:hypothetical protein
MPDRLIASLIASFVTGRPNRLDAASCADRVSLPTARLGAPASSWAVAGKETPMTASATASRRIGMRRKGGKRILQVPAGEKTSAPTNGIGGMERGGRDFSEGGTYMTREPTRRNLFGAGLSPPTADRVALRER